MDQEPSTIQVSVCCLLDVEFLAATMEKSLYMREEKLYQAFKMFDLDASGKISGTELKEVLGSNIEYRILNLIIRKRLEQGQ